MPDSPDTIGWTLFRYTWLQLWDCQLPYIFAGFAANRAISPKWPNRKICWVVLERVFQKGRGGGSRGAYHSRSCQLEGNRTFEAQSLRKDRRSRFSGPLCSKNARENRNYCNNNLIYFRLLAWMFFWPGIWEHVYSSFLPNHRRWMLPGCTRVSTCHKRVEPKGDIISLSFRSPFGYHLSHFLGHPSANPLLPPPSWRMVNVDWWWIALRNFWAYFQPRKASDQFWYFALRGFSLGGFWKIQGLQSAPAFHPSQVRARLLSKGHQLADLHWPVWLGSSGALSHRKRENPVPYKIPLAKIPFAQRMKFLFFFSFFKPFFVSIFFSFGAVSFCRRAAQMFQISQCFWPISACHFKEMSFLMWGEPTPDPSTKQRSFEEGGGGMLGQDVAWGGGGQTKDKRTLKQLSGYILLLSHPLRNYHARGNKYISNSRQFFDVHVLVLNSSSLTVMINQEYFSRMCICICCKMRNCKKLLRWYTSQKAQNAKCLAIFRCSDLFLPLKVIS